MSYLDRQGNYFWSAFLHYAHWYCIAYVSIMFSLTVVFKGMEKLCWKMILSLQPMVYNQRKMPCQANGRKQQLILLIWNLRLCWEKCHKRYFICVLYEINYSVWTDGFSLYFILLYYAYTACTASLFVCLLFSMEQVFNLERVHSKVEPLHIQSDLTVKEMLGRVLRLPAVASKRYLTNKVIRISYTGSDSFWWSFGEINSVWRETDYWFFLGHLSSILHFHHCMTWCKIKQDTCHVLRK